MPTPHTIPPTAPHTHTIILLHGRDSDAATFAAELVESQATDARTLPALLPHCKWVFPASAPRRRSARFACDLAQWFDVWSLEDPEARKELQTAGLAESVAEVLEVVEGEAAIVGRERVVLGGISQGAATAVHALLHGGRRVGAFVGFCGWLPLRAEVEGIVREVEGKEERGRALGGLLGGLPRAGREVGEERGVVLDTPVLLEHCVDDDVVPVENGEKLRKGLRGLGMVVEWHAYEDGGHWVNEPKGVDDLVVFLRKVL